MKIKLADSQRIVLVPKAFLVVPFFSEKEINIDNQKINGIIKESRNLYISLKEGESRTVFSKSRQIIFLNVGEKNKWTAKKFFLKIRTIVRLLKHNRAFEAIIFIDQILPQKKENADIARQISENILLADYEFNRYKEKPKGGWPELKLINIATGQLKENQKDIEKGEIVGKLINFSRDLSNTPGGEMTPQELAKVSLTEAKKEKIGFDVFDKKKLEKLGMGGILGVSHGSIEEPKLIILKYSGDKKRKDFDMAFVGKGITFDSGGLQIKPANGITDMHLDMSGGAAVLAAVLAISKMKFPLNIVGLIPAAENMPSGQAFRPGDLLKSYSGKTIEVGHTDAEGRIILADALSYAVKNFKPKMVVDVATLTGAAEVALGYRAIAAFSNSEKLEGILKTIGDDSGDYAWPLPCWEEYEEENKGTFGDISNIGKYEGMGGAIVGAVFLKAFVSDFPWIHLDIAPTTSSIENQGLAKGSAGSGIRYLVKLAEKFEEIKKLL